MGRACEPTGLRGLATGGAAAACGAASPPCPAADPRVCPRANTQVRPYGIWPTHKDTRPRAATGGAPGDQEETDTSDLSPAT